jgi:hypothetical protein
MLVEVEVTRQVCTRLIHRLPARIGRVPLNKDQAPGQQTSFLGGLAVGRYFTPHNVPFGDLVFYCESNFNVPLDGSASRSTLVTVGPGTRFHIANNYFFLMDLDVPVTGNRPAEYSLLVALLKVS